MYDHVDVGVEGEELLFRRLCLLTPYIVVLMQHLPLEVREIDDIEVDDADRPYSGEGQVERRRAAKAAGADDQDLPLHQFPLTRGPDLGHDDVARVAGYLLRRP